MFCYIWIHIYTCNYTYFILSYLFITLYYYISITTKHQIIIWGKILMELYENLMFRLKNWFFFLWSDTYEFSWNHHIFVPNQSLFFSLCLNIINQFISRLNSMYYESSSFISTFFKHTPKFSIFILHVYIFMEFDPNVDFLCSIN